MVLLRHGVAAAAQTYLCISMPAHVSVTHVQMCGMDMGRNFELQTQQLPCPGTTCHTTIAREVTVHVHGI